MPKLTSVVITSLKIKKHVMMGTSQEGMAVTPSVDLRFVGTESFSSQKLVTTGTLSVMMAVS